MPGTILLCIRSKDGKVDYLMHTDMKIITTVSACFKCQLCTHVYMNDCNSLQQRGSASFVHLESDHSQGVCLRAALQGLLAAAPKRDM